MARIKLYFGLLLATVALTGFTPHPGLHIGRSVAVADGIEPHVKVDRSNPSLTVKITNRTGEPALLAGWLAGSLATAEVPPRSAMVTLRWEPLDGDHADLRLGLYAGAKARPNEWDPADQETHWIVVRARTYYPVPPSRVSPPAELPPSEVPPTPGAVPPELAITGATVQSYAAAGLALVCAGLLLLVMGLARSGMSRRQLGQ